MMELTRALAELAQAREHSKDACRNFLDQYLEDAKMHLDHWKVGVHDVREYLDESADWHSETQALADYARFQLMIERGQADVKAMKAAAAALR